jgi:hypothetical protein
MAFAALQIEQDHRPLLVPLLMAPQDHRLSGKHAL